MSAVLRYIDTILAQSNRPDGTPVRCIEVRPGEQESFKHALQDLLCSGMVRYTKTNPELVIKRVA